MVAVKPLLDRIFMSTHYRAIKSKYFIDKVRNLTKDEMKLSRQHYEQQ